MGLSTRPGVVEERHLTISGQGSRGGIHSALAADPDGLSMGELVAAIAESSQLPKIVDILGEMRTKAEADMLERGNDGVLPKTPDVPEETAQQMIARGGWNGADVEGSVAA